MSMECDEDFGVASGLRSSCRAAKSSAARRRWPNPLTRSSTGDAACFAAHAAYKRLIASHHSPILVTQ
jgi:hypothetical protein